MPSPVPGNPLERLFSMRVRPLALVCALFVVITLGVMAIGAIQDSTAEMQVRLTDLRIERDQQYKQYRKLEDELQIVETDDYIMAKARQIYGYMMPDEKLFVIKNPEALYGETDEPVQMAVLDAEALE
ncbi:MAG: septum formation initiator family protein [Clostridia bacterium]|nr:septum formation initiator family protein [Clostridia bacterium]